LSENIDEVRRLIGLGVNVNAPDDASDPTYSLSSAVEMLSIDLVKILINAQADVNRSSTFNGSSISPLGKVMEVLVESKRDPDSLADGMTIVKILIDAGANMDSYDDYFGFESTPLQAAASEGRTDLVKLLLYEGADVNALPNVRDGKTALQAAAGLSPLTGKPTLPEERLRIVRRLLADGADINAPPSYSGGMTALQAAAQSCNMVLVRLLLNKGANVNSEPAYKYGMTALQAGAVAQNLEIIQILLDAGANVNGATSHRWGVTALQAAVRNMNTDEGLAIVRLLLSAGADIDSTARSDPNTEAGRERFELAVASHRTPL
jgi:ankyrin repeat protein